jgi:RNA polymerase sigma-70 factor (ECF subfamily)
VPFSSLAADEERDDVDADRFLPPWHERRPGGWACAPQPWPDEQLEAAETVAVVRAAIGALPPAQREVMRLRDVEGWDGAEVCAALALTAGNQRVLLHRGRTRVRAAIEEYLAPVVPEPEVRPGPAPPILAVAA